MFTKIKHEHFRCRVWQSSIGGRSINHLVAAVIAVVAMLPALQAMAQQSTPTRPITCNDVSAVTIDPANVTGGMPSTGTVTLKQGATQGGLPVRLTSENSSVVAVPDQIIVPAGALTAAFPIQTSPVSTDTHVFISAFCGTESKWARRYQISVRPPRLQAIELTKVLRPGGKAYGKVTLNGPAPAEGLTVQLQKGAYLTVPDSVVVPPGQSEALFEVHAENLAGRGTGSFTGRAGGSVIPASMSVDPNAPPPTIPTLSASRVASNPALTPKAAVTTASISPVGTTSPPLSSSATVDSATTLEAERPITEVKTEQRVASISPNASAGKELLFGGIHSASSFAVPPASSTGSETVAPGSGPTSAKAAAPSATLPTLQDAVAVNKACVPRPPPGVPSPTSTSPTRLGSDGNTPTPVLPETLGLPRDGQPTMAIAEVVSPPQTIQTLRNPSEFKAESRAPGSVQLSWTPIDGVECYWLQGPGLSTATRTSSTVFLITKVPAGVNTYLVHGITRDNLLVDEENPSSATVTVLPGPHLRWEASGIGAKDYVFQDGEIYLNPLDYQPIWFTNHNGVSYQDHCCNRKKEEIVSAWKMVPTLLDGTGSQGDIRSCKFEAIGPNGFYWSKTQDLDVVLKRFSYAGETIELRQECWVRPALPADVDIEVRLTVSYRDGSYASIGDVAKVHDFLVVALGDSYGSGEGAGVATAYKDKRCHRSQLSAQSRVAQTLEDDSTGTSVTFVHLACSGAQIEVPGNIKKGGLLDPYAGVAPDGDLVVLAQLEAARVLLDQNNDGRIDRPIDALLISIGGNDANFAHIVLKCGVPGPLQSISYLSEGDILNALSATFWLVPCYSLAVPGNAHSSFSNGMMALPGRFNNLRAHLIDKLGLGDPNALPTNRVYMWEYPIATQNESGHYCNGTDLLFGTSWPGGGQGMLGGFTADEFEWADKYVGPTLNGEIAATALSYGWTYIAGIAQAFRSHGICAVDSWLVRPADSKAAQDDVNGTFHPTPRGYLEMSNLISPRVVGDLVRSTPR